MTARLAKTNADIAKKEFLFLRVLLEKTYWNIEMPRAFSFFPLICHKNVYTICMMMHCYLNIHTWSKCKKLQKKTPSKMYRFLWKSASVDRKPKVCWTKTTFTSGWPHCKPLQGNYRVELVHREIPVVITGNEFTECSFLLFWLHFFLF